MTSSSVHLEVKRVEYVWYGALPLRSAAPQQLFLPLGHIPGESPAAEQLPDAHLLTPCFYTGRAPLSLTAHTITQRHSFIYYRPPPP